MVVWADGVLDHSIWPVRESIAKTVPVSSAVKYTDLPGNRGDVAPNGTIGEREWATPCNEGGTHGGGQSPPELPLVRAWSVRSLETARIPFGPIVGGTTAVAPVA
jgi:hypothetical protein